MPTYFAGSNDLRPVRLETNASEPCRVVPVHAYLTNHVHFFLLRLAITFRAQRTLGPGALLGRALYPRRRPGRLVVVHGDAAGVSHRQSLNKRYPIPFRWIDADAMGRAAGWICSGSLVAQNLGARSGYMNRPMVQFCSALMSTAFVPNADSRQSDSPEAGLVRGRSRRHRLSRATRSGEGHRPDATGSGRVDVPWRALFVAPGLRRRA